MRFNFWRFFALLPAAAAAWMAAPGPAAAQDKLTFCRSYANTAVSRNQQNERLRCGYSGSRWQSNAGNHFRWCMGVSRDQANSETRARTRQINECRDRRGAGKRDFCRNYANAAVSRNRQNESLGCGYRGSRWQSNASNHFRWCMGVSRGQANNETNARTRQIRECRDRRGGDRTNRDFCRDYANAAVARNRQNESLGCGYRGSRWQSNTSNHFNWCMRASRDQANSEANARTRQIRECRDRRGGDRSKRAFCEGYANAAVARQRQNRRYRCGFTGSRWQENYSNHYRWCMRAPRDRANSETSARSRQINACIRDRGDGRRGSCDLRDARLRVRSSGCDRSVAIPFGRARLRDGSALRQAINTGVIGSGRPPYGECNFHTDIVYRCERGRLVIDRVYECRQNRSGRRGANCSVSN